MTQSAKTYPGLLNDQYGGMTSIGNIIKDAWVFDLLPAGETCDGWRLGELQMLYDRVTECWRTVGYRVANLAPEQQALHAKIQAEAIARAKAAGWDPSLGDEDET